MSKDNEIKELESRVSKLELLLDKHFKGFLRIYAILIDKGLLDDVEEIEFWQDVQAAYTRAEKAGEDVDFIKMMNEFQENRE